MDAIQWLEFFQTFTVVNTLRLGRSILPSVLRELEGPNADSVIGHAWPRGEGKECEFGLQNPPGTR